MKKHILARAIRIISINIEILLLLLVSPTILLRGYETAKSVASLATGKSHTKRLHYQALYPVYKNQETAEKLYSLQSKMEKAKYRSFLSWKSATMNSQSINIEGPYSSRLSRFQNLNNSTWFFGGSTIWGFGAEDDETIPSFYSILTKSFVYNFGELGWTSRQSLNQMLNALGDGNIPDRIIFFDGVNDVWAQCRTESKELPSDRYELKIRSALDKHDKPFRIEILASKVKDIVIQPYLILLRKLQPQKNKAMNSIDSYAFNCSSNPLKAAGVAKHLVNNWHTAHLIAKSKKIRFNAILQPTIFTSETNTSYIASSERASWPHVRKQYETVYPLILKEINLICRYDKSFCDSFIDGRKWLWRRKNIFIDFCHIGATGNLIIAGKIINSNPSPFTGAPLSSAEKTLDSNLALHRSIH